MTTNIPRTDGIYWIQAPIKGSNEKKYWPPFIADCRVNGPGVDVYQTGIADCDYVGPGLGYRFSEEVSFID